MPRTKLPKKVKAKWIKALRSGEYEQGRMKLYDYYDNTYCCLGVACRLGLGKEDIFVENERLDENFLAHEIQLELARLNDQGVPFEVIAGVIDEML